MPIGVWRRAFPSSPSSRSSPNTERAIAHYEQLDAMRLNVGKMDLKIAAIALEHGCIVVTRNERDFRRVPGLVVENWAA